MTKTEKFITLLKNEATEAVEMREAAHRIHTPMALVREMLSNIDEDYLHYGDVLVLFNLEFLIELREMGVDMSNVTFYSDDDFKSDAAKMLGVTPITELPMNKTFDVCIMNPNYNKHTAKGYADEYTTHAENYPHLIFFNAAIELTKDDGIISCLMPASFMTLASLSKWRETVIDKGRFEKITLFDNNNDKVFKIEHTWIANVLFVKEAGTSSSNIEMVKKNFRDDNNNDGEVREEIPVELDKYTYIDGKKTVTVWPMFISTHEKTIFEKVRALATPLKRGGIKDTLNNSFVGYVVQGSNDRPLVNATPVDRKGVEVKAPGYLLFDNDAEATDYCNFMYSKLYKVLIGITKCISKTQPQSIVNIGNFDFAGIDTTNAADLYKFFGLTAEEIAYIESI